MKRIALIAGLLVVIAAAFAWLTSDKPATSRPLVYAALGDSVAAGYGLPAAKNASQQDHLCGRSPQGYPALVAKAEKMELINVSCAGATTADVLNSQNVDGTALAPQLEAAFKERPPDLITLTIGANDARWNNFIQACYTSDCDTPDNTAAADAALAAAESGLKTILDNINDRSRSQPPRTVVTGYYNLIESGCEAVRPNITDSEIAWFKEQTAKMNDIIKETTSNYRFARYAQADLEGHDLCSDDSWIQGIFDRAPLHPTREGQTAIAKAITAVRD